MVDDTPEDTSPLPDSGRAKRAGPTIDLEASEVKEKATTKSAAADAEPEPSSPPNSSPKPTGSAIASIIVAVVSGACAAALVIAVAGYLGWPAAAPPPAPAAPVDTTTATDALAARIAGLESQSAKPAAAASDPALTGRVEALEKSLAAGRGELAALRAQSEKLAADLNAVKAAPRDVGAAQVDMSAINERIAQIERTARAQNTAIAQENAKPADDVPLRRVVAASLLDVLARTGDPYPAALTAAKSLASNPDALKPLEAFAAAGVPNPAGLNRELLTLVPKLQPPAADSATTGSGLVERLQAGASKLVRIERTDTTGDGRGAVVGRVTAAALRNDLAEARRELNALSPADRAAAQDWLDKADARDAALAASRQFATEAMTALAKPAP
jgi:hypothetical protein